MSRLFVKNLPKKSTQSSVRKVFESYGTVTDCSLKYNKDGVFRQFAYIGFSSETEAQNASDSLNHTYINTSKIQVEVCKDLSHSNFTNQEKKLKNSTQVQKVQKPSNSNFAADKILGNLDEDEGFQEFLNIHKAGNSKTSWKNDDEAVNNKLTKASEHARATTSQKTKGYAFEGDSDSSDDELAVKAEPEKGGGDHLARDKTLSDLDYLRKKAGHGSHLSDDEDVPLGKARGITTEAVQEPTKSKKKKKKNKQTFIVKLRNLPFTVNKMMIQSFFQGITVRSVDIPRAEKNSTIGVAYVHFRNQTDVNAALRRNRNKMANKKVFVSKAQDKDNLSTKDAPAKEWDQKALWEIKSAKMELEPIADSGRLFVRNLVYSCTEEDLEELFSPFGSLAEVELPIDSTTKKIKGFAHITYMFPEHAVLAFNQLDGTTFKGRMLHILPGRFSRDDAHQYDKSGMSIKEKKEKAKKDAAQSSHNWNSLFLGADAVANAMARKYGIKKSDLLDPESKESLGVRLALGETEIVNETRDFLLDNGVSLDSFSQASGPRSKTVILVKNLPKKAAVEDLMELFSPFGILGKVVLPPSGITALVEFQEQQEAKAAFGKLAYKRFYESPLYLEWAPVGVFLDKNVGETTLEEKNNVTAEGENAEKPDEVQVPPENTKLEGEKVDDSKKEDKEEAESESDSNSESDDPSSGEGCTLFVKNLNFDTTESAMKKHFKSCGKVVNATIAVKRDPKKPGKALSMGYGFVQFREAPMVQAALKELQHSTLDKHTLELKLSERTSNRASTVERKRQDGKKKQTSTKILVRNIPFQANRSEVTELFKVFGELKLVRLPKKVGGQHRGFAFVDFITKNDAKRAFKALCHSTHLYGRRLVLEWADTTEESVDNLRRKTAEGYSTERKKFKRADMQSTLEEMNAASDEN
ncbi:probable RNA-binding protein 19 isoform X2 [Watersipora subatra]|uniref:probable RNA-binding protein 19 isoform X2 n=1 Tax=Watersipora subatra TaxID=2589382 RepID=UPI00355C532D